MKPQHCVSALWCRDKKDTPKHYKLKLLIALGILGTLQIIRHKLPQQGYNVITAVAMLTCKHMQSSLDDVIHGRPLTVEKGSEIRQSIASHVVEVIELWL